MIVVGEELCEACSETDGVPWASGGAGPSGPAVGSSGREGSRDQLVVPEARSRPLRAVHEDLVKRRFVTNGPDRLWCTDITQHPTQHWDGLLLRGVGRVHPGNHGLVDRGPHAHRPGRRRVTDGALAALSATGGDPALGPRIPIHFTGIRSPVTCRRNAGIDGPDRLQRRQHNDEIVLERDATNCWTSAPGPPSKSSSQRSSNGSKPGTTLAGATPISTCHPCPENRVRLRIVLVLRTLSANQRVMAVARSLWWPGAGWVGRALSHQAARGFRSQLGRH